MPENILKVFIEKGFLLDKEMLDFLNEFGDNKIASELINKIAIISKKKVITKTLVNENLEKIRPFLFELDNEKKKLVDKYFVNLSISLEIKKETSLENKKENEEPTLKEKEKKNFVKVLSSPITTSQKIEVGDFIKHFRNRYNLMKKILQEKSELNNLISIDKLTGNRDFSIIGIITNKQITKNKNVILEVEDLTGKAKLLITKNKDDIYEKSKEILLDDVIGFKCSGSKDFLYVNDFFYPDCYLKDKKRTKEEVYVLFISDIHVGSKTFLENNFNKFIDWLNGQNANEKQKEELSKIKYLFVIGDSIEGVGVYPGQEKDLAIKDIREQYEKLAGFYKKVPKYIDIIQCAGQHDAVRVAEPQPPVGDDFGKSLYEVENLYLVSNPAVVEIENGGCIINGNHKIREGIKVLMYHGASMHSIINEIDELRLANAHSTPAKVVKHLLLRRHLAPSHGATIYIPCKEDPMLIRDVPDILTTGDLHRTDIDSYNNVLIISN
ncbi:MAG: metallophosphoesterase, partial [Nanoarchaeota archaeon]